MSEQACKCGRLRDIHILLTQDECAGYEPAAPVAEPLAVPPAQEPQESVPDATCPRCGWYLYGANGNLRERIAFELLCDFGDESAEQVAARICIVVEAQLTALRKSHQEELERVRKQTFEDAAKHIEDGSAFSGYSEVGAIHAQWLRNLANAAKLEGK